ncbi:hypothetical protein SSS_07537 [Sarcoptes scabiei]|uniref:Uncharacterized protein n=1 Tax=Sarcoptes scabiei TaxID=52283 RepID=A0A834VBP9_SARSC|nr:hypothetical protein SSS_07537 [Sarcoptes scabiei]
MILNRFIIYIVGTQDDTSRSSSPSPSSLTEKRSVPMKVENFPIDKSSERKIEAEKTNPTISSMNQNRKPIGLIECRDLLNLDYDEEITSKSIANEQQRILIQSLEESFQSNDTIGIESLMDEMILDQNGTDVFDCLNSIRLESLESNVLKSLRLNVDGQRAAWLIRAPCRLLIRLPLIVHRWNDVDELKSSPSPQKQTFRSNEIFLIDDAQLCFTSINQAPSIEISIVSVMVKKIETIPKELQHRKELVKQFLQDQSSLRENITRQRQQTNVTAEFLISYSDKYRSKPVALAYGEIEVENLPEKLEIQNFNPGKLIGLDGTDLSIKIVIDEKGRKDRHYILKHWSLIRLNFVGSVLVCNLESKCRFRLPKSGSICFAGYVCQMDPKELNLAKPISGLQTINIENANYECLAFVGDHFLLLMPNRSNQTLDLKFK